MKTKEIKFIDLFAGMGGTRIGFEQALLAKGLLPNCVFTSELKTHAVKAYKQNFDESFVDGDINNIINNNIPDFDYMLAGFPCQPFSAAGNRHGFLDRRGGLFFRILDILLEKQPEGFLLENVEGLLTHDNGKTLKIILNKLENINYNVDYVVLNAVDFGVPQARKRVYIVGSITSRPIFKQYKIIRNTVKSYINYKTAYVNTEFTKLLSSKYTQRELEGKSIKDKRGGIYNIHSWDIGLKGEVSSVQKSLLSEILKKRRSKKWAENKGIHWMDGMPLTLDEIKTFYQSSTLEDDLKYLTDCGYLKFEHPKERKTINGMHKRVYKTVSKKGYNIISGKLSFPMCKILDPNNYVPTIVATEAGKIGVACKKGVRKISVNEGLKFSGFPEWYTLDKVKYNKSFDLLGNTVMPPVIKYVSECLLESKGHASKESLSKVNRKKSY